MTALLVIGMVGLFFIIPYLAGNVYGLIFRKKDMGILSTYLSGMAIMYALLTTLQLVIIKFKFDFAKVTKIYHILLLFCIGAGIVCFCVRLCKDRAVKWDAVISKKSIWILGLILLQGILYIGLKNPYFEQNALLETARVTLETGTIYQYNAFTGMEAQAGFPLANKLIFLPILYAYISVVSGVEPALLFNFVMPTVTFLSFYMVMLLWVQRIAKERKQNWELLLLLLVWIVQVGDGFSHSTSFRVLHSGYTGEAIFFGVLLTYALYQIKNRCYLIVLGCLVTFPGLVKFDAVAVLMKSLGMYWKEAALGGGMLLLYVLSVLYFVAKNKRVSEVLLNVNLTILILTSEVWREVVDGEKKVSRKVLRGSVLFLTLLMCGNITMISDVTEWRSNIYGAPKTEYQLLMKFEDTDGEERIQVAACDELVQWIKRLGLKMEPVVGYDLGGKDVWWYSYEEYGEDYIRLWSNINDATGDMEQELVYLSDKIDMDYVMVRRITDYIPITDNDEIICVYDTPSYLVYLVDNK